MPPHMSAVEQAGGMLNFNNLIFPPLRQSHCLQLFKLVTLHGYNYIIQLLQSQRLALGKMQC